MSFEDSTMSSVQRVQDCHHPCLKPSTFCVAVSLSLGRTRLLFHSCVTLCPEWSFRRRTCLLPHALKRARARSPKPAQRVRRSRRSGCPPSPSLPTAGNAGSKQRPWTHERRCLSVCKYKWRAYPTTNDQLHCRRVSSKRGKVFRILFSHFFMCIFAHFM